MDIAQPGVSEQELTLAVRILTLRGKFLHLFFQYPQAVEHFGQVLRRDELAFGLAVWGGRNAEHATTVGDVAHDTGLGAHHSLVTEL